MLLKLERYSMTRGPKPKPSQLKELEGNPGKRGKNKTEPKPESAIPACPSHLKGAARTEWNRLAEELFKLKILTNIDRAALAICCTAWANYVKACNKLEKEGEVMISEKGGMYQNPWVGIRNRSMDQIQKFYSEFGMTPSSRSRVHADNPTEEDEMAGFLFGNKNVKVNAKQ